ncbi:MAG TPA: hypothetical protein VN851_05355 [Thermoanaerobaculia bacterium]|nr:hypothetical protein [Thermoanaerobaculia bacterium]
MRDAWAIAKDLEIHELVEAELFDLVLQREQLKAFCRLVAGDFGRLKVSYFDGQRSRFEGKQVCIPLVMNVILGNYRGTLVISVWGNVKRTGKKRKKQVEYEVVTSEKRVERMFATKADEDPVDLRAVVSGVAEIYKAHPCIILEQHDS